MGKPFQSELLDLPATLTWAFDEVLPTLASLTLDQGSADYCVGSGGSQSAADFLARLLRGKGRHAWATTPLEYLGMARPIGRSSTFLLSAGGRNKDIIAVSEQAQVWESGPVVGVTARARTPLGEGLGEYGRGAIIELPLPNGKDGFLATNSLVAMMACLPTLVGLGYGATEKTTLMGTALRIAEGTPGIHVPSQPEFIILHAGWSGPAALDLESKLSEAALASSMICDLRSFGHGRHHWLAKRPGTIIVALIDYGHRELFSKTLALLPPTTHIIRLESELSGAWGAIDLTLKVFGLVRDVGIARGIDPGRPGVPDFGRKIYHLAPGRRSRKSVSDVEVAVKRRFSDSSIAQGDARHSLEVSAQRFRSGLDGKAIRSVVLDYDGTLVDTGRRFESITEKIRHELVRLIGLGITVGIATGRGKSVRERLRESIPEDEWGSVLVGYYNGSQILPLDDGRLPDASHPLPGALYDFLGVMAADPLVSLQATVEPRPLQLTVSSDHWSNDALCRHLTRLLNDFGPGLKCLVSSHSVDVVPNEITKLTLVKECARVAQCGPEQVLTIGDSGLWPGNDSELLSHYPALSCGSQYSGLSTGWNLAPCGLIESWAVAHYLRLIFEEPGEGPRIRFQ